jgi:serine/threonine-protein kinase HipA
MIQIWTDLAVAGMLDRSRTPGSRGTAFAYLPLADPARGVSVTMPVRLASWDTPFGLAPIFEMGLPEGALRERLRLAFSKATGTFDDFDLLAITGRSQIGRLRFTAPGDALDEAVPFQSVEEILASRRGGELFRYLLERFAVYSGISGVQPKVLVRDQLNTPLTRQHEPLPNLSARDSLRGATHIVKFWEQDFPQLAANEHFCLRVAERCGLEVPRHRLSDDGLALVVDRFDLRPDGTYRGFEDFCVLNARRTDEKYRGSYETAILKRFSQFAEPEHLHADLERLFTLIALNCAIRNGDAHLKNFGIRYDEVLGPARLAPVYDLVTTTAYIAQDRMALTLDGSTEWPTAKQLVQLGQVRAALAPAHARAIFERIADALAETVPEVEAYAREHPAFVEIGKRMLAEWELGRTFSLGLPAKGRLNG